MGKIICIGVLALVGVIAHAASLVSDDFNRPDTANASGDLSVIGSWENSSGSTWKIGGNELVPVTKSSSYYYAVNNALETAGGTFTLKATVIVNSANTAAYFGMTWNHTDENNNYVMRYFINGTVQVLRRTGGNWAVIKNVANAFSPVNDRGYEVTISSAAINDFTLTITDTVTSNDVYTTSWTDASNTLTGGYGGFYANTAGATYDDFSLEIVSGTVVSNAAPLPFLETFEVADGITNGTINGQNGWVLESGTADVQSSISQAGSQALQIQNAQIVHDLSSDGSAIWLRFQARCEGPPDSNPDTVEANASLAFFINTNLNLVVYSNTVPVELNVRIQTNIWTRFDIYCDYDDLCWDLSMDGTNVVAGLPFYSSNRLVGALLIGTESSSSVYIDQIDIVDVEPTAGGLPDSDSDEIPDWWEQKHFGGVASVVAGNISGNDGLTYLQTYIAGVSPTSFDPFEVSTVPGGNGLRWNPVQSRWYSVYWTPNLTNEFNLLQGNLQYPQSEFIDSVNNEEAAGFYYLKVWVQ